MKEFSLKENKTEITVDIFDGLENIQVKYKLKLNWPGILIKDFILI